MLFKEKNKVKCKPFVKWVGGKTQMLKYLDPLVKGIDFTKNKYIEPFVGGGALFFHIQPKNAIISDFNKELITAYRTISGPIKVKKLIKQLQKNYKPHTNNEEMYYKIRSRGIKGEQYRDTARFIYLNKAGFNGLYRVNKKGDFNVPFGQKKKIINFEVENLINCSKVLKETKLYSGDFYKSLQYIKKGDFVYLDPPYAPISKTSDFTQYTKKDFKDFDQLRLKEFCDKIDKIGAKFIANNSDISFIKDIYSKYHIIKTPISRMIAADKNSRKKVNELIIHNMQ